MMCRLVYASGQCVQEDVTTEHPNLNLPIRWSKREKMFDEHGRSIGADVMADALVVSDAREAGRHAEAIAIEERANHMLSQRRWYATIRIFERGIAPHLREFLQGDPDPGRHREHENLLGFIGPRIGPDYIEIGSRRVGVTAPTVESLIAASRLGREVLVDEANAWERVFGAWVGRHPNECLCKIHL